MTKKCSNCQEIKSVKEFHKGNGKLGRRSQCKICCKQKYYTPEALERRNKARRERRKDKSFKKKENSYNKELNKKYPRRVLYRTAKARAKRKNINFTITLKDIVIPKKCPLLGIDLVKSSGKAKFNSPSLDRIDNTKGYIPGNVWVISYRANKLKNDASLGELELLVKNLRYEMENK